MSRNPALRLVTDTLHADTGGISATRRYRQVVIDGEASIRLRKEIGNDYYSVLEVLFILCEHSPSGVVVHDATERLREILGWGRDKVRAATRELEARGFIQKTQEAASDKSGRHIYGRGVLRLDVSAVDVVPETDLQKEDTPTGWGVWGRPLAPDVSRQMLASWGVRGADRLIEADQILVSDAVKFVQNAMRTGSPIDNPGAYVRTLIANRRVAAPDPSVPPALLSEEVTLADLMGSDPSQRESTLDRSRSAKARRRQHLDAMLRTGLDPAVREEIEMLLDDDLRDFAFTSPEAREVYRYHMLEERLAERGVLSQLPDPERVEEPIDPDEPPF